MTSTLAIRPQPGPDETFAGYILRAANRNEIPVGQLTGNIVGKSPGHMLYLTPRQRHRATSILGLSHRQIDNLVIEPPDVRKALQSHGRAPRGGELVIEWAVRTRHSLACPKCLADASGVWQRIWRLAPVIVCPIHAIYLERSCARCEKPWFSNGAHPKQPRVQQPYPLAGPAPPHPNHCVAPSTKRKPGWCGAPIERTISKTPSAFLVDATRRLLEDWPWDEQDWKRRQAVFRGREYRPSKEKLDLTDKEIKNVLHAVSRPWRVL